MSSRPIEVQSTDSPGTPDRWMILALVSLNYFVLYLHRNLLNYIQPPLKADLNLIDFEIGILRTAWLLPYCLVQLRVGYLSDRYRRRTVLLCSLLASVVALGGMGFARNFEDFFYLRILLALGQSASVPAMAGTIADCFTTRTRSKAVGIYLFSYSCALVVAGKYGGKAADIEVWHLPLGVLGLEDLDVAGWRMAHFLFAGLGGLAFLIVWFLFREPERTERRSDVGLGTGGGAVWKTVWSVLRVPTFLAIALVFALTSIVISAVQFWLPAYFHDNEHFRLSLEDAGFFATLWVQIGTVAGLLAGGIWADRWARRFLAGRTGIQLIGMLGMAPTIWVIGTSHSRPLLATAMTIFGFGIGLYQANLWTTTFEVVDPAARSTAVGLLNLAAGVLVYSWVDPAIGWIRHNVGGLGVIISSMSLVVGISVGLMVFNMIFLLPRDYRGPLRHEPADTAETNS